MTTRSTTRTPATQTRTIVLLGFEGCAALDLSGPHEVFALTSHLAPSGATAPYRLVLLADRPGPFRAALGFGLIADASWKNFRKNFGSNMPSVCWKRPASLWTWPRGIAVSQAASNYGGPFSGIGGSLPKSTNCGSVRLEPSQ